MSWQPLSIMKISRQMFIASIVVAAAAFSSAAQTVSWRCTTVPSPWADKGTLPVSAWDNDTSLYITVDPSTKYQVIEGWGGAVNEIGWDALSALSQASRDSVLKAIFDSSGCGINVARIPIGANDYSMGYYSCDDSANDFQINYLTLAREKLRILPYLKGALRVRPNLKVWGSPWSPPGWMKTNKNITSGSLIQTPQNLTAYALYFAKWVKAMQAEGIPLFAVHVQNEPHIANNYPSCLMSGTEMRTFIRDYLGPRFKSDSVKSEIWVGTISGDYKERIQTIMDDNAANAYITGIGLQWGMSEMIPQFRSAYPTKKVWQTELMCGNFFWAGGYNANVAPNDWSYGIFTFNQMSIWIKSGVTIFNQWNMVLDSSGRSWDNWPQNSMISVFKGAKTVRYNPHYYVVKHFGRYVTPGAHLISATGNFGSGSVVNLGTQYGEVSNGDKIAFINPDGGKVIIVRNSAASARTVAVRVGTTKFKPALPANSINTFTIGTPVAVHRVRTEKHPLSFRQSRGGIGFSIPKVQTARLLKLEVIDALGKTVAVPIRQMSEGGDYFVRCNFTTGRGVYFARLHFNGIVAASRLVF